MATRNGTNGNDFLHSYYGGVFYDIVNGLNGNDVLNGWDEGSGTLNGDDGDDILFGSLGSDNLNGGNGSDLLRYLGHYSVYINLASNIVHGYGNSNSHAEGDTISGFENVHGSYSSDEIIGNSSSNTLEGAGGGDTIYGGGGDDYIFAQEKWYEFEELMA